MVLVSWSQRIYKREKALKINLSLAETIKIFWEVFPNTEAVVNRERSLHLMLTAELGRVSLPFSNDFGRDMGSR